MAKEIAANYAAYMNVGLKNEMPVIHETIDEMLTRLDEFENLVSMIHGDASICAEQTIPSILASRGGLEELCNRVDRLEQLVDRVDSDLSAVETAMEQASSDLEEQGSSRLKTFLKPLFFKNDPPVKKTVRQTPTCDVGGIFVTEDFFPSRDMERPPET